MAQKRTTQDSKAPAPKIVVGGRTAANREKRIAKAKKACGKKLKVPRGTARAKRRVNILNVKVAA